MADPTSVSLVDCAKTYARGATVLQPTSLHVEAGEVIALIGPSGCGKTTLLRIVAGLVDPDPGGTVRFGDDDVTHRPIESRGVGMVFQHYALFPHMTVADNIAYGLRIRRVDRAEQRQRVGELIDLVRLNGLESRRPAELSGGQKQRVALARAVALRPRILLLDEPLTALDAKLKESLRDELAQLLRRLGITAIHVTHDQQEAMAIADRLAVMSAGAIVQVGDAEALYRTPALPFVAEFLGRVNRLRRADADLRAGIVRIAGRALHCHGAVATRTGLLVRPEDIELKAAEGVAGQGVVARRVFLGDRLRLDIDTADQGLLVVDTTRDAHWRAGDAVSLHIAPDRFMPAA